MNPHEDLPHTPGLRPVTGLVAEGPGRNVAGVSRSTREARRWRFFYGDSPLADIFVSYARQDRPRVAPLVAALEKHGWSVWWDPEITPGEEFDALISRELEEARSLIVVWTPQSVESRWVRGEARDAADRGMLVPVRFDNARLPIDFRAMHATDLDGWNEDRQAPAFLSLCKAVGGQGSGRQHAAQREG